MGGFVTVLAASAVASMMFSTGLKVELRSIGAGWRRPRAFLASLAWNLIGMPLLAYALIRWGPMDSERATAFLFCAVAPGGPAAVIFAGAAGANLAATASLTVSLSVISVISAPLILAMALGTGADAWAVVPDLAMSMWLGLFLPLCAGWAMQRFLPSVATRLREPFGHFAKYALWTLMAVLFATNVGAMLDLGIFDVLTIVGWVAASIGVAAVVGGRDLGRSFAMSAVIRNGTAALLLSAVAYPNPVTQVTIVVIGIGTLFAASWAARFWAQEAQDAPAWAPELEGVPNA